MSIEIINFRDFGGYPTRTGAQVTRDRLYRCGQLNDAPEAARAALWALDFEIVADLRYPEERSTAVSGWPAPFAGRIWSHDEQRASEAPHIQLMHAGPFDAASVGEMFTEYYRKLPFESAYRGLYRRVLGALPDLHGRLLVHCTAGKDRTGLLVALIHHALGVEPHDIMRDYLASQTAPGLRDMVPQFVDMIEARFGYRPDEAAVRCLVGVEPVFLDAAFAEIEARCGSVDGYLDELGLGAEWQAALRARLLET